MLTLHDVATPAPDARPVPAATAAEDDWLAVTEDELRDAHAEASRMIACTVDAPARLRHARSVVLLEQLLAARAVVRARAAPAPQARAALRHDRALGYFFGLAASGGDPTAAPPDERALAAALRHVHGLVYGMAQARRAAEGCPIEVGAAFGDGLLAAEADLHAFVAAVETGRAPAMPVGLLPCLSWMGAVQGGDPTARPN